MQNLNKKFKCQNSISNIILAHSNILLQWLKLIILVQLTYQAPHNIHQITKQINLTAFTIIILGTRIGYLENQSKHPKIDIHISFVTIINSNQEKNNVQYFNSKKNLHEQSNLDLEWIIFKLKYWGLDQSSKNVLSGSQVSIGQRVLPYGSKQERQLGSKVGRQVLVETEGTTWTGSRANKQV